MDDQNYRRFESSCNASASKDALSYDERSNSCIPIGFPPNGENTSGSKSVEAHALVLLEIQGEVQKAVLHERDNRYSLSAVVNASNTPAANYTEAVDPSNIDLFAALEWIVDYPDESKNNTNRVDGHNEKITYHPHLHIGSHIVNGVIEKLESEIAVLRFVNFQNQSTSPNSCSMWEITGYVSSLIQFLEPPMLSSVKIKNLQQLLSEADRETLPKQSANILENCSDNTKEVWKLVISSTIDVTHNMWRLMKIDMYLSECLKKGFSVSFKSAPNEVYNKFPLVLCTSGYTYSVEKNERDAIIFIGLKFDRSCAFDDSPSPLGQENDIFSTNLFAFNSEDTDESGSKIHEAMENEVMEKDENLSKKRRDKFKTLGIPLIGNCHSLLVLHRIHGLTSQVEEWLSSEKCRTQGVATDVLLSAIQSSERELVLYFCGLHHSRISHSLYHKGKWKHLQLTIWYEGLQNIFDCATLSGYDFSTKEPIKIGALTEMLQTAQISGAYKFAFPFLITESIVYQILRFAYYFDSSFWRDLYNALSSDSPVLHENLLSKYIRFLESPTMLNETSIHMSLPKLQRFIAQYSFMKHGKALTNISVSPLLLKNMRSLDLEAYLDHASNCIHALPTSILILFKKRSAWINKKEPILQFLEGIDKKHVFGLFDAEGEYSSEITQNINTYEHLKYCTTGFPDFRKTTSINFNQVPDMEDGSNEINNTFLSPAELLRNFAQTHALSHMVCNLSLLRGFIFYLQAKDKLVYLPENLLPNTLRERLIVLFSLKSSWYEEELQFYLGPLLQIKDITSVVAGPPYNFCWGKVDNFPLKTEKNGNTAALEAQYKFIRWNLPVPHWAIE